MRHYFTLRLDYTILFFIWHMISNMTYMLRRSCVAVLLLFWLSVSLSFILLRLCLPIVPKASCFIIFFIPLSCSLFSSLFPSVHIIYCLSINMFYHVWACFIQAGVKASRLCHSFSMVTLLLMGVLPWESITFGCRLDFVLMCMSGDMIRSGKW